ncbi:hypothetical protein Tco_1354669 [Tanacetum coccineum]
MNKEKETTEHSDDVRNQFEAKCNKKLFQGLDTRTSSTNSFNNVNTLVNNASASRTFYHVGPSSGPPLVSFNGSLPIDVHDYPNDPFMPNLKDTAEPQGTGIFNSAYDDDDFTNSLLLSSFPTSGSPFQIKILAALRTLNSASKASWLCFHLMDLL